MKASGDIGSKFDMIFKLIIIGDTSVGKTSLLLRFSDDAFNESHLTTIGKFPSKDAKDLHFKSMW